jgi:citrate lyase subunit beta/citryl-CoA lyase
MDLNQPDPEQPSPGHLRPPVRSLLFIPGNRAAWMPKAVAAGADAVVFDLEGSLPPADKETGRRQVREVIDAASPAGPAVFVRVNDSFGGEMPADLDVVAAAGLAGVLVPQVRSADEIRRLDEALSRLESARGLPEGSIAIDPLMETPQALYAAYDIATCSPRIAYMGSGISRRGDIARNVGYRWTPEGLETLYFRSKVLLEVRAAGVPNPLSGMWGDIADLDGLRALANQTRDLGYEGMMVIHPTHVPVVNEIFSPDPADIERWKQILTAMDQAHAEGRGAIRLNGEVVDEAHVLTAKQELAKARRFGL